MLVAGKDKRILSQARVDYESKTSELGRKPFASPAVAERAPARDQELREMTLSTTDKQQGAQFS